MKKNKSIIIISILLCLIAIAIPYRQRIKTKIIQLYSGIKRRAYGSSNTNCIECDILFNDGIAAHERAYRKEKIKEQATDEGLLNLNKKNVLKIIESNDNYIVREMDNSQPMLLPKAIEFLDKLSNAYQQKCNENKSQYIPFEVTSATRSKKSIEDLRKKNKNAIKNSPHLRGKTFDISYTTFNSNEKQLQLFVNALSEFKNRDECYVKHERNGCLHITVN